ncbi:hypothetical protein AUP68_00383 [Ilyonectria robusta]
MVNVQPPTPGLQPHERDIAPGENDDDLRSRLSDRTCRERWRTSVPGKAYARIHMLAMINCSIVVLCSHFVVMNTWGFTNSFGSFQTHLTDTLSSPPSTISWIGSMQIFLLFFMGTISGRLTDSGHFRVVFFVGSLATVVGILASSFCHQFWQFFLALGVAVGIGNGCLFCPMLTVMSPYFDKRRAMAIGIAACGSASGGLIYSSIARQLVPSVGLPWTMRTISLIQFALLAVANVYLRPRVPAKSSSPWVDWAAFRDMSVVGRLGFNYAADRYGTINVYIPVACATAIILFTWIGVKDVPGTYGWAIACGITSGGVQSLFPAALSSLTEDTQKLGVRIGMIFTIVSISSLIGPPISGALIDALDGRYLGAQIFAGTSMSLSALFLVAARRAGRKAKPSFGPSAPFITSRSSSSRATSPHWLDRPSGKSLAMLIGINLTRILWAGFIFSAQFSEIPWRHLPCSLR